MAIEVIAWDRPGVRVAMEGGLTPQEAIAQGLPQPAECDLVLVIFWSRIGTPLPAAHKKHDESHNLSGTVWEYENALAGFRAHRRPRVWVYRRTEEPRVRLNDPEHDEKVAQWKSVSAFFDGLTNPDGSLAAGVNTYETPEAFRWQFEQHLRSLKEMRRAH